MAAESAFCDSCGVHVTDVLILCTELDNYDQ